MTFILNILLSLFLQIWNQHKILGFLTPHINVENNFLGHISTPYKLEINIFKNATFLNILQKVYSRVYQKPTKIFNFLSFLKGIYFSIKPEDEVFPQDEEDKV